MTRRVQFTFIAALAVLVGAAACGPNDRPTTSDATTECLAGQQRCDLTTFQTCSAAGTWELTQDCPVQCSNTLGCVSCEPGAQFCKDGNVFQCDANGQPGAMTQACEGSNVCVDGGCVDACQKAAEDKSYQGCEYWAVDLHNAQQVDSFRAGTCAAPTKPASVKVCTNGDRSTLEGLCDPGDRCRSGLTCQVADVCVLDAQTAPYAIVVSNPQSRAVAVTLTAGGGQTSTVSVAAGQVATLFPQQLAMPDASLFGSGITKSAYKVTSSLPIVAYQFNPLNNVDVFSNDASLLVPRSAFDAEYYAMTAKTLDRRTGGLFTIPSQNFTGYVTVVAVEDGTQVEVTPKSATEPGAVQGALVANAPTMFTLNAFDVLNLEAVANGDLTGSRVRVMGGKTAGVFSGHQAFARAEDQACCADHLEEMMFPTSTWGKRFALARAKPRMNETDVLRVMAQKPNTTVTFSPAPTAGTCGTLVAGQFCEVQISLDTEINSSEPVLIGHYLKSIGTGAGNPVGDPSMSLAVPVEQFRADYTFLIPAQYDQNFVSISAPVGGVIKLDGANISGQLLPFGTNLRGARIAVTAGQHKVECPNTCGIEIYGYSGAVSYLFAGGLDLKKIVVN
ncbi:MAG: IgGFc-binding protein [Kofleriaceae bacterium]|nr:IgGFc-binding protein [Kofleriaceae bacterium]